MSKIKIHVLKFLFFLTINIFFNAPLYAAEAASRTEDAPTTVPRPPLSLEDKIRETFNFR